MLWSPPPPRAMQRSQPRPSPSQRSAPRSAASRPPPHDPHPNLPTRTAPPSRPRWTSCARCRMSAALSAGTRACSTPSAARAFRPAARPALRAACARTAGAARLCMSCGSTAWKARATFRCPAAPPRPPSGWSAPPRSCAGRAPPSRKSAALRGATLASPQTCMFGGRARGWGWRRTPCGPRFGSAPPTFSERR